MSRGLRAARATPPGRILVRELEARGWTQKDLAKIIERPPQAINEIVKGRKQITPETALELAEAFGTSPELWTNLEAEYRLRLAKEDQNEKTGIARRSRLYGLAPVAELIKRRWIQPSESFDDLERQVCAFLGILSTEEMPELSANFRASTDRGPEASSQITWIKRVEHLVQAQKVADYDPAKFNEAIPKLLTYANRAEDSAFVPSTLLKLGVHFVIVPHLPKTYLDGAAFYFDERPVVALTLRYDRIDAFWFTLMHELAHVVAGHQGLHLDNFDKQSVNEKETEANQRTRDWLVDPEIFDAFVRSTSPYFSKKAIQRFAEIQGRHPGIILGQLQHRKLVGYNHLRSLLVKVTPFLKPWIDVSTPQNNTASTGAWAES